jgi:hypothetical protein
MSYFSGQVKRLTKIDLNDIVLLRDRVSEHPDLWEKWDALKPNRFGVFNGNTQHIVFKYPVDLDDHRLSMTFPIWQEWKSILQPLIDQAVAPYDYKNGAVARIMLARLHPGCAIGMHIDSAQSAELPHKIHIPLKTSEDVVMTFADGESHHLAMGGAYEVNNRIKHGVHNPTRHDRIHLIFDYFDQSTEP